MMPTFELPLVAPAAVDVGELDEEDVDEGSVVLKANDLSKAKVTRE